MSKNEEEKVLGTFEDAGTAAREMFEQGVMEEETGIEVPADGGEGAIPEEPGEAPAEEVPAEEVPAEVGAENPEPGAGEENPAGNMPPEEAGMPDMQEQAVRTAEQATQLAQQKDMELQQIRQQLQQTQQQNQQLMEALSQMSDVQRENLLEEALEPPKLDFSRLPYEDEAVALQRQNEYAEAMANYVLQKMGKSMEQRMEPLVAQAKLGKEQAARAEAIAALEAIPELEGFHDRLPQIEQILQKTRFAEETPLDQRMFAAYAMARGMDSISNPPKDPTAQELMAFYDSNPEFQELLEQRRLEQVKSRRKVPPLSASSGGANAALNIPEKPKTFEEAFEATKQSFGL